MSGRLRAAGEPIPDRLRIHLGVTAGPALAQPALYFADGRPDGAIPRWADSRHLLPRRLRPSDALAGLLAWAGLVDAQRVDFAARRERIWTAWPMRSKARWTGKNWPGSCSGPGDFARSGGKIQTRAAVTPAGGRRGDGWRGLVPDAPRLSLPAAFTRGRRRVRRGGCAAGRPGAGFPAGRRRGRAGRRVCTVENTFLASSPGHQFPRLAVGQFEVAGGEGGAQHVEADFAGQRRGEQGRAQAGKTGLAFSGQARARSAL